jgi:hypothetical protein
VKDKIDTARWQRAQRDTKSLADWKVDIARAVVAGAVWLALMALLPLSTAGFVGQLATVLTFVVAVGLVLAIEFGWNYAVAGAHMEAEHERRLREEAAEIFRQREAQLQKALAVSQAQYDVFKGVAEEEKRTGQTVPLAAQLARLNVVTKVATGDFGDKK